MNGRIYDPQLGRFLSADTYVQFPYNSQSYNRYSYVHNNPLTYNDPSGHFLDILWDIGSAAVGIFEVGANLYAGDFKEAGIAAVGAAIDIGAAVVPFVPGGASIAIKATKEAGEIAGKQILKEGLEEGAEKIAKEVGEKVTREGSSLTKIDNAKVETNLERGVDPELPRNNASPGEAQVTSNQREGARRQSETKSSLEEQHPSGSVQSEQYLRTADGKIAKDPDTGTGRRIDNVVIEDGQGVRSVETTSPTANKRDQTAKENRIREAGGTHVRDRTTRDLVDFQHVETEIDRRP